QQRPPRPRRLRPRRRRLPHDGPHRADPAESLLQVVRLHERSSDGTLTMIPVRRRDASKKPPAVTPHVQALEVGRTNTPNVGPWPGEIPIKRFFNNLFATKTDRKPFRPALEALDERRLPSTVPPIVITLPPSEVTASLSHGVLHVDGTLHDDHI